MKSLFKTICASLRQTWLWSLLLVLTLALAVWYFGPLLAVDDHRFWADASARLFSIAVLFLTWGLLMVFAAWRATRRHSEPDTQENQERLQHDSEMKAAEHDIRERFAKALRTLRTSSLYHGRGSRRHELPWYLLLGPQAAGKTTLLQRSGLEFPLNPPEAANLAPHDCEWFFATPGVIIEGSGHYPAQVTPVIGHAWRTLLGLLRKRRRTRPLNGILVAVPVDLLWGDENALMLAAQQIRARLLETRRYLRADVPVYLVLSKADLLPGFDEFFDGLSREECDQVLGASFGKDQNGTDAQVLRQAIDDLLQRLQGQVITRMHLERDIQRRGRILDFPHQLGRLHAPLALFIETAFTGNRYQPSSRLRGFYLTSAAPEAARPVLEAQPLGTAERPTRPEPAPRRPRFIQHLFDKVVFPEAELAGLDTRETRRLQWRQRAVFASAVTGLGLFGALWASSFIDNHERLDRIGQLDRQLQEQRAALLPTDDARDALKALDSALAASRVYPASGQVPLREHSGLYQGAMSNPVLLAAYHRELEQVLLPRIARALETRITASLPHREQLLASLRAYLMLNLPERRNTSFLKDSLGMEWSTRYPGDTAAQNRLDTHFGRLLERPFSYPLNEPLVAKARQVLRGEPLASVVYRELREQASHLPQYRLSQHLGPQDTSLIGTDRVIPGLYTRAGHQQYFLAQSAPLVRELLRDNWVLGESDSLSGKDLGRLMTEVQQLYWRDYADHWGDAIGQVRLQPIQDAGRGADDLAGLTAASSPLLHLLRQVREHTHIVDSAPPLPDATPAALGKAAQAIAAKAAAILPQDSARHAMQRRFEPLHRLLDDEDAPAADLAPLMRSLNDLQLQLAALARASQPQQAAFELASRRMGGQLDAMARLRSTAARLPQPVGGWFVQLAEDSWTLMLREAHAHLNQRYRSELREVYAKAIDQRYPFDPRSGSEVAIADFREFFKEQGVVDRFFENYLRPFVSGDPGSYRLRSVDGHALPLSSVFLAQIGRAYAIRRGFFAEQPGEPRVRFRLEPYSIDSSLSRADFQFDDRQLAYRHGPIVPMTFSWPADNSDGRTSLVLEALNGRRVGIEESTGPWSLFRLLDQLRTEHHRGRDALMLKADLDGLRASYLLLAQRSPNPFDLEALRGFRLPASL